MLSKALENTQESGFYNNYHVKNWHVDTFFKMGVSSCNMETFKEDFCLKQFFQY